MTLEFPRVPNSKPPKISRRVSIDWPNRSPKRAPNPMTMTQFAMVEELASLIKDNLYCKHLVLSTEEALINFLQNDSSPEGILELQPMGPYQRLLLHRLADIYGFVHGSVGEGEERHLLLERCPETAIPPILVSDILWQYNDYQSPSPAHLILRRKESPETKVDKAVPSATPLVVREAAYLAARERIFSLHEDSGKEIVPPKSRKVPAVAQRMIAHALGQKVTSLQRCEGNDTSLQRCEGNDKNELTGVYCTNNAKETSEVLQIPTPAPHQKKVSNFPAKNISGSGSSEPEGKLGNGAARQGRDASAEILEKERLVAAKRIFAQALGVGSNSRRHDVPVPTNECKAAPSH